MRRICLTFVLVTLCAPLHVHAQHVQRPDLSYRPLTPSWEPAPPAAFAIDTGQTNSASIERLLVGGLVGWGLGLAAGAGAGYALKPPSGESYFGAVEWWVGAWIGSSIGAAAGVHIANHTQGNALLSSLGTLLSVPAVVGIAATVPGAGPLLLAIPTAQIAASILIERRTARARER
jgi:hypothetical protein